MVEIVADFFLQFSGYLVVAHVLLHHSQLQDKHCGQSGMRLGRRKKKCCATEVYRNHIAILMGNSFKKQKKNCANFFERSDLLSLSYGRLYCVV